jgi:DNA (cytosine-5)-methyltransferase 1
MSDRDKSYVKYIKPGGNYTQIPDSISSPRIMRIKKTGGRTTTYGRLHKQKFSATVNTYFNRPNVGTNYHYSQQRLITPREAMRIQSFPDSFSPEFSNLRSLCKQIGNAVPPLLSIVLAKTIKSIFRK